MTATTDPFDRTLGDWLASLEADEPAGLQAHVVEDARSSAQRRGWLARADLAVVLAPRTGSPSGTGVALVIVGAMLAVITVGLLAGGRVVPTVPAPVPSLVPGPSTALIAPVVPAGSWEPVDSPGIPPGGLALTDADFGRTMVIGEEVRLFDPIDGTWTTIAQPHLARRSPAVAGLPDGRVLIAGGQPMDANLGSTTGSAELYSPRADRWTEIDSMATTRAFGMTATTLRDGRILVVAGTEYAALPSAELFDPASGIWTTTGSMHEARSGHTATLLADGRVLVTGGSIVHTSALRTAEIFDPATGAWSTVAPMSAERTGHTSTLLDDGSVLVTGGHLATDDASLTQEFTAYPLGDGPLASAQRFDPATGRWTPAGTMAVGRYGHTATLLSDGMVLVAGGVTADGSTPAAEVYDPVAGTWLPATDMSRARHGQVAAGQPDGSVLVVGGDQAGGRASAERFILP